MLIFLIIILVIFIFMNKEKFTLRDYPVVNSDYNKLFPNFNLSFPYPNIPLLNGHTNFTWNNTQYDSRKGMTYDLRGDPYRIPRNNYIWNP